MNLKPYSIITFLDYLEHCYRYYVLDSPIISDEDFDEMCKWLNENYDIAVKSHPWAKICGVKQSHFKAGTGYDIKYPKLLINSINLVENEK